MNTNTQYFKYLFLLCTILQYQFEHINDFDLMNGIRTLEVDSIVEIVGVLNSLLYAMYWQYPVIIGSVSSRGQGSASMQLFDSQLVFVTTKLYNQIAFRNERMNFADFRLWIWKNLNTSEFLASILSSPGEKVFSNSLKARLILQLVPQAIPFQQRIEIFQNFVEEDKVRNNVLDVYFSPIRIDVMRDDILHSAFDSLKSQIKSPSQLKHPVKVTFISHQGVPEAGIDGGGLFTEFINDLLKEACNPTTGLFTTTPAHLLVPSRMSALKFNYLEYFTFLGRMLGKAIYEKNLVEPQFAGMFLNQLLGRKNFIDDLKSLDEQMYLSVMKLKQEFDNGLDVETLGMTFEVESVYENGYIVHTNLIPGGAKTIVTRSNFLHYLNLFANFKLNIETSKQCQAFLKGFRDIIPLDWIRMFNSAELQLIIGGDSKRIDLEDLMRHATYSGGYHPSQPYIQDFWNVMKSFSTEEQSEFLRFVTSCSRQPLLGFKQLNPPFNITKVPLKSNPDDPFEAPRLPQASSCFHQFKLPIYSTVAEMREKILYAINSKSGFELS